MNQSYHNTNGLSGAALQAAVARAHKQEDAILLIYKETRKAWSPSQIHTLMERAGHRLLLTSTRRAITNLTDTKDLIKLPQKRKGPHGQPEGLWVINPAQHPTDTGYRQSGLFT